MILTRSMMNKKNEAIFDKCEKLINAYMTARNKECKRVLLFKKDYESIMKLATEIRKKERMDKPEELFIGSVKLEKADV